MYDLALAQELYRVADLGIVNEAEYIIVCCPGLLFGGHIFAEVGYRVALGLERGRAEGDAGGGRGPDACGMVDKIILEALGLYLFDRQVAGQLIDDGAYHFEMGQLFGADIGQHADDIFIRHGEAL